MIDAWARPHRAPPERLPACGRRSRILLALLRAVLRLLRHLPEVRSPTHRGTLRVRRAPDLAGEHHAGRGLRQPTSVQGTLRRKTSDCTVRPGSSANNSARAGRDELDRDDRQRQCGPTVTSSRGRCGSAPNTKLASVAAG